MANVARQATELAPCRLSWTQSHRILEGFEDSTKPRTGSETTKSLGFWRPARFATYYNVSQEPREYPRLNVSDSLTDAIFSLEDSAVQISQPRGLS